ncbi:MAG: CsbD family protein [Rhodanobacteraceae bacterium]
MSLDSVMRDTIRDDRVMLQWSWIADRIQRRWRKLTREDVVRPGGNSEYLASLLQVRYGVDRAEALLQVREFESGLC